jgi:broad specificity phosphatase PhoE
LGATDLPVSKEGHRQAGELAQKIMALKPDICLCSPMLRTRQTAAVIGEVINCEPVYMDELREINFGRWERLTFNEIAASYPEQTGEWAAAPLDFTFPQGDNTGEFFRRIGRVAGQLAKRSEGTVLVVSHGGVISALICHFLGLPFDKGLLFRLRPAGLVSLEVFERLGVLTGFNL